MENKNKITLDNLNDYKFYYSEDGDPIDRLSLVGREIKNVMNIDLNDGFDFVVIGSPEDYFIPVVYTYPEGEDSIYRKLSLDKYIKKHVISKLERSRDLFNVYDSKGIQVTNLDCLGISEKMMDEMERQYDEATEEEQKDMCFAITEDTVTQVKKP